MRGSLLIGTTLALMIPLTGPSSAQQQGNAAWCLWDSDGNAGCFHYTFEACQTAARGLGGTCYANQNYRTERKGPPQRPNRRPG